MHSAKKTARPCTAAGKCENCGKTYATVKYGRQCPYCESGKTYLLRGQEINVKEIEAV